VTDAPVPPQEQARAVGQRYVVSVQ